jgi:RNA recognition motif-containing protein
LQNYEIIVPAITHQWSIMKLLVRNLSRSTTEQELRILFSAHGTVTECNLVLDQATAKSKGFGFVVMPDEKEAKLALSNLHETKIANNKIRVKIAQ